MKKFLYIMLAVYSLCVVTLYLAQRKLMYFPTSEDLESELPSVTLGTGDLQLKVLISEADGASQNEKAILYFPGNAENVWWVTDYMRQFFADHTVYYLNYPGYGGSSGAPNEQSILTAATALYEFAKQHHHEIVVMGRSLGTGVAVDVASKHPVTDMILISPYDSIVNVAAGHYPIFPVKWLIKDKYHSLSKVPALRATNPELQVITFAGSADKVVPAKHSDILVAAMKAAGVSVNANAFEGYGHNNITEHPEFLALMQGFFTE